MTHLRSVARIALCTILLAGPAASGEVIFPLPETGERAAVLDNLRSAVAAGPGSIDLMIGGEIDEPSLAELLAILETAPVPVRVSVSALTPERDAVLDRMEAFGAARSPAWPVCRDWWTSANDEFLVFEVGGLLSGGIVFIDNGIASGTPDNPDDEIGDSLLVDPAFAGVISTTPRRISDPHEYWTAATAIWHRALLMPNLAGEEITDGRLLEAGWRDGC